MNHKKKWTPPSLEELKKNVFRPSRATVTGGMPYANGPIHLGHLAGALIPPDIHARYMRMLIGKENVLFVCGNDDHGSTSELAALKAGVPIREFINRVHHEQAQTLNNYNISFDTFSGTSQEECYPVHEKLCQEFIRKLDKNALLKKKISKQWYDPHLKKFLQDRLVTGQCPNPKCDNESAYSDQCDACGSSYETTELINPRSNVSQATPELKDTTHWWLNLWEVSEPLRKWIQSKEKKWRTAVYREVLETVLPALSFANTYEDQYKALKKDLPKHKSKYAAGKKLQLQFNNKEELLIAKELLDKNAVENQWVDGWAHRSISRDVQWGVPMPQDLDPEMKGKTLYVWPDSLIAPLSFSKVALKKKGLPPEDFDLYWKDPDARIYQFLGQDNVYFYVLMQGALWLGTQENPQELPQKGDYQLSDVFGSFHLWVSGQKMSKSTGNFHTGDELLNEKQYTADQVRYFLATLTLADKNSNFDFEAFNEKNKFLAGPLNAAFEKPLSACHSKYEGSVPKGELNEKILSETTKLAQKYFRAMERADYHVLLGQIENYARNINSLFTQHKPHDDRHPLEDRQNALFSCFYVLKNLMIMLHPFAPSTMDKLRQSLNLPESSLDINELGVPIPAGHKIAQQQEYFPPVH